MITVSPLASDAAYCTRCQTHMHPSNGAPHMRRHETEDALRAAEAATIAALAAVPEWLLEAWSCDGLTSDGSNAAAVAMVDAERERRCAVTANKDACS